MNSNLFSTPESSNINLAIYGTYCPQGSGFAFSSIKKRFWGAAVQSVRIDRRFTHIKQQ